MSCKTSFSFLAGNLAAPITTQSQPQLVRLNPPARNTSRDSDDTIIAASGEDATTANSRKTLVRMPYDGTELVGVGPSRTRLLAPSSQSLDFHPKLRSSILSPIMFFNIFSTFSVKESTNGATKPGMQPKPGQPTATRNKKPPALGRVLKALKPPISKTRAGTFQIASTSGSSNSRPSSSSARHPLFPSQPIATTSYPSLTDDPRSSLQSSVIFTMKVLAIIAIVLAYGPVIFDLAVTGRAVIQPTRTSITDPALSHFYTLHMDKPSPVIPPTGLVGAVLTEPSGHNNQDSAVSIWTIYRITTHRTLANIGTFVTSFNRRRLDRQWRCIHGWWRFSSGRVIEEALIVSFYSLLFHVVQHLPKRLDLQAHGPYHPPRTAALKAKRSDSKRSQSASFASFDA